MVGLGEVNCTCSDLNGSIIQSRSKELAAILVDASLGVGFLRRGLGAGKGALEITITKVERSQQG